jgi:hypothetical protein
VPDSSILAAAVGIVLENKKLLVWENLEGQIDLPGFILADGEEAIRSMHEFIRKFNLDGHPQQTLYLTALSPTKSIKKKVPAIIRLVHLPFTVKLDIPNTWYEPLTKLSKDERITPITRIVTKWLTSD